MVAYLIKVCEEGGWLGFDFFMVFFFCLVGWLVGLCGGVFLFLNCY